GDGTSRTDMRSWIVSLGDRGRTPRHTAGTSQAAPHVAGVAALVLSARPGLSGAAVEAILKDTARMNAAYPRPDPEFGYGLVDAEAAVEAARSFGQPTPTGTLTATPTRTPTPRATRGRLLVPLVG
ncbi:MAG TPA: S8 family serine peptidase, partial [Salinarimonas sp.]|nr:S8 family serine peptidase [Salinarimonas sp.]